MPEIVREAERYYLRACPPLGEKHCPGVTPLLDRLTRRGAVLGLVTGNLTRIAWRKLERAGLRQYFRFGAFGEMAKTRGGLARMAIAEARRKGWISRATTVSLVGDAPADILAARQAGIRSIAVATGLTVAEDLERYGPNHLLRDLRDFRLRMAR
jgi:phosphoglycolate phosphatase-like HAD superfamily hydrolase